MKEKTDRSMDRPDYTEKRERERDRERIKHIILELFLLTLHCVS